VTDDRRSDQGDEPVEPDDASDWLAAQFDGEVEVVEEGVDGGTEADADDDGASPPTRAFAPVARPDEEEAAAAPVPASAPEPAAPARAEPALPESAEPESTQPESAQPESAQPPGSALPEPAGAEPGQPEPGQPESAQPEPVLSVPPAPSADDEVPRSSGHPLALDLSGLAGAVVPDPPRGASTDAGDAPAAEDPHGSAVAPPGPAAPAPADPDEPGPFTALISAAPGEQAATPQEFRWEDLPAPEAEAAVPSAPDDGTDGGTHETSDEPEESRVEPADTSPESVAEAEAEAGAEADAPTRAVPLAPAADAAPAADDDVAAAQTTDADADADADAGAAETPPDGSEAAAAAPWWVAEHHEMTRRERRQAEAAGLIVPPAGVATPTPATAPAAATPPAAEPAAPDDAAAPDAPAAGPDAGPSFTEILGIVPAARADDDPGPDSVEDVPGEASADAGRDDPIDETVPAAVDRVDAGTLDAAAVGTSTTSWSLSGLDAAGGDHAVRAGEPAVGPASPDLGAEPAPPAGSEAPLPFLTPSRPDLPLERARETRPSPEHLPGVDAASASASASADGRTSVFPVVAPAPGRSKGGPAGIADWPRRRKVLLGVAAALVVVLALVAVFFLGRSLFAGAPSAAALSTADEPAAASTRTVTAAPIVAEEPAAPAGPLAAGSHPWSDLQGGECLGAFENAWQQEYDVVDCAQPHAAQLVEKASLSDDPAAAWPGSDALRDQTGVLCTAPTAVDLAAAATLSDVQFVASWPTTAEEWAADRSYSCFVSRAGGEPLTASLAAA